MAIVAFVRPTPDIVTQQTGPGGRPEPSNAYGRLRLYGRTMSFCFILVLASWIALQIGCLLSLFLHFRSGIVVGTIDGSLAFKFWPPIDYFASTHALAHEFSPKAYPQAVSVVFSAILIVASAPFCASLAFLTQLFAFYAKGEVFTERTVIVMRRIGHSIMATGYSPLLLGPAAHLIGVLKPVTGLTNAMIAFFLVGLILLATSHVMTIGQRLQQDQEEIL